MIIITAAQLPDCPLSLDHNRILYPALTGQTRSLSLLAELTATITTTFHIK